MLIVLMRCPNFMFEFSNGTHSSFAAGVTSIHLLFATNRASNSSRNL